MDAKLSIDLGLLQMTGRKLYQSHPLPIVARELIQNARDACVRRGVKPAITVRIEQTDDAHYSITVIDNGIGMTETQLVNNFLRLGGSDKRGDGTSVGGFGIAKAAIMSCIDWEVHTLDNYISRDIVEHEAPIERRQRIVGTTVTCWIVEADWHAIWDTLQLIYTSDIGVHLTVTKNGAFFSNDPHAGMNKRLKRTPLANGAGWEAYAMGEIKYCQGDSLTSTTIYRLGGLTQYVVREYNDRGTNILIDITPSTPVTDPQYPYTMSRESLAGETYTQVRAMTNHYNHDILTLKSKLNEKSDSIIATGGLLTCGSRTAATRPALPQDVDINQLAKLLQDMIEASHQTADNLAGAIGNRAVILHNYSRKIIPQKHVKILEAWRLVLSLTARKNNAFGVGLTTDDGVVGERMSYNGRSYYIINPECFDSIKNKTAKLLAIWTLACHECAHFVEDCHNESFTSEEGLAQRESAEVFYDSLQALRKVLGG